MLKTVLVNALLLVLCALLFLLALWTPLAFAAAEAYTPEEASLLRAYERGDILRLHVLANSDSPEDQALKRKVRDAVLAAFGQTLAKAGDQSAEEVYRALLAGAPAMEAVARACARENGFPGDAKAEVGPLYLPEKQYGRVTLPAGVYRGLRITLGKGEGQNWWCILFPRLCLALSGEDAPRERPQIQWASSRILRCWLGFPDAGAVVEPVGDQGTQHADAKP